MLSVVRTGAWICGVLVVGSACSELNPEWQGASGVASATTNSTVSTTPGQTDDDAAPTSDASTGGPDEPGESDGCLQVRT